MLRKTLPMLMVFCLGVVCLFVFFAALGSFSPAEVLWLSAGVAVLALVFAAYALWVRRHLGTHGTQELFRSGNRLSERRGF